MKQRVFNALLVIGDIFLINVSFYVAFLIRFDGRVLSNSIAMNYFNLYLNNIVILTLIKVIVFYDFGLYNSLWRYASIEELLKVITTSFFASAAVLSYTMIVQQHLPRSIYILAFLLDVLLIGGLRFSYRMLSFVKGRNFLGRNNIKRVMIVGAGQAGAMVIKELKNHPELRSKAVVVMDDDPYKLGRHINGVPVKGDRYAIEKIAQDLDIDEIIISIPGAKKTELKGIVEECSKTLCKLKTLPGIYELIDGKVSIKKIRDVDIEDLLGREANKVDLEEITEYLHERVVLVTGGGGSIGSELCRQIARFNPKKLILLDIYENSAFELQNELLRTYPELDFDVVIASIRDKKRMEEVFEYYLPEVVFHAAAHKHVPLMEKNPQEAVKNNVFGTKNVAECAEVYGAKRFVLISTDKAVNPTNIMGATKRAAEMIIQSMNKNSATEFVAVRFGNVLGSNGSVIPLFKKQIAEGGPVTITHPEVTRYFMTIEEAVQLVIQAGAMAKGGEIFVLDMGEPVKIMDLAKNLIRLSGFEPEKDVPIKVTGLRPGEKLYEELLMGAEELEATKNEKIFICKPLFTDLKLLHRELDILNEILLENNESIKNYMTKIVPSYIKTS